MIRYPIRASDLKQRIEDWKPGWIVRAAERTAGFEAAGRYDESGPIWSEIKQVYMDLQGAKCGFCERQLEQSLYGSIEHDVEHFRPKAKVKGWPTESDRVDRGIDFDFPLGGPADPGYYLLPYHMRNYLIACKTCNSRLKANYFPVREARRVDSGHPAELTDEKAYLIYPIGSLDTDPEEVITFRGIVPIPAGSRGHIRKRGLVTIRFFELDTREVLLTERAEAITTLHLAMMALEDPDDATGQIATSLVDRLTHIRSPHANCSRAFHDIWLTDRDLATEFAEAAAEYLDSTRQHPSQPATRQQPL